MIKVLPSLFTLGNLLCGFASIFYCSRITETVVFGRWSVLTAAASLIFLGMVFDALDGRVARMTRQTSELGEQLDSMSDMVTFGVAPAFLAVQLIGIGTPFFGTPKADTYFDRLVLVVAGVYVACCALRLARFNIEIDNPEEADHMSFKGMPSPAAAGTVASLVLLHQSFVGDEMQWQWWTSLTLVAVTTLAAIAMVSTMRYSHLLNRYIRGRAPFEYIVAAVVVGLPLLIAPNLTLAAGLVLYALSAPATVLLRKFRKQPPTVPPLQSEPHAQDDRPPLRIRHN